jgi:hypothetical protein
MTEQEVSASLDRMVADNRGKPIQAYFGERIPVMDDALERYYRKKKGNGGSYYRKELVAARLVTCSTCSESEPQE